MSKLSSYINDRMQDPDFRGEWDKREPERELMHQVYDMLEESGTSRRRFAKKCGIRKKTLENLLSNPEDATVETLENIAQGMGKKLNITFE